MWQRPMWTDAHNHCSSLTCRPTNYLSGKGVLSRKQPAWQGWRFIYYLSPAYKVGKRAEIAQSVQSSSDALDNSRLVAVKYFFFLQSVQKSSGAHPASCSKGNGGSLPKETAVETRSWPRTSIWCHRLSLSESCLSPACAFMARTETSLPLPYQ